MFDPDSVNLMNQAPELEGLESERISQTITEAYAEIVSSRIRMRELQEDEAAEIELPEVIQRMRRLAFTQEAFVASSIERENRAAAAFVAASAHHACLLAEKLLTPRERQSNLSFEGISSDVSATILFLCAEASADAAEISKLIQLDGKEPLESKLLHAIKSFASGDLSALLRIELLTPSQIIGKAGQDAAVRALYQKILEAMISMAARMLDLELETPPSGLDPIATLQRVQELCTEPAVQNFSSDGSIHHSVYPGPLHLATLLQAAFRDFLDIGIVNVPPPTGIDGTVWSSQMRSFAKRRPFLWRNHRQALAKGYLDLGKSSSVSFPTGAGKSTLAELKIATAVLRGKKVVFLAPTLALVDQTTRALGEAFPDVEVFREKTADLAVEVDGQELPAISVVTPERCLAFLNFAPELFAEVELVVFDECHLLHPRSEDKSRRAVDAMMCILNLSISAPSADLLFLSAMMKNSEEVSSWIQDLTNRPCIPLDLLWKPTRQVRGCVVYSGAEIQGLNERLRADRQTHDTKGAPQSTRRKMITEPYAFFCLNQTWNTTDRKDYSLQKLLDEEVNLSVGSFLPKGAPHKTARWYLTPNGVQVSQKLAEEISKKDLKTIVFLQTIPWAISANKKICANLTGTSCVLTEIERANYDASKDELGDAKHLYISIDEDTNTLKSSSACHHGHLLNFERSLHESLFKRKDGLNVLIATSTLSQGMNLPGDVVIIGGDSRFDLDAEQMSRLEAHELLNAAGRAGRAGERSHGLVIVVPSKVVDFDNRNSRINSYWTELRGIFSQSDQCLTIEDPLEPLLDRIHETSSAEDPMTEYLVGRLPLSTTDEDTAADKTSQIVARSFAAYKRRQSGDSDWIRSRIDAVHRVRSDMDSLDQSSAWQDRLSASIGFMPSFIRELAEAFAGGWSSDASVVDWRNWYVEWLTAKNDKLPKLIRSETLDSFLGSPYKELEDEHAKGQFICAKLFPLLDLWMSGEALREIELAAGTQPTQLKTCERARDFVSDVVPELSYLFGVPSLVAQAMINEGYFEGEVPLSLSLLSVSVKEGFDTAEKAVLRASMEGIVNRRSVHAEFEGLSKYLPPADGPEDFRSIQSRLDVAKAIRLFV